MTQGMANNHQKEAGRGTGQVLPQDLLPQGTRRDDPPISYMCPPELWEKKLPYLGRPVCDSSPRKLTQAPTLHLTETAFILL